MPIMEVNSPAAVRHPDVEELLEDPVTAEKRKGEVVHFAGDGKQMREGTIYINRIGKAARQGDGSFAERRRSRGFTAPALRKEAGRATGRMGHPRPSAFG